MSITLVSDIATQLASPRRLDLIKTIPAAKAAGAVAAWWLGAGNPTAGSAAPNYDAGSGYTCDKSTTGAIIIVNGGTQNWLARARFQLTQPGTLFLYDRLWSCGNMGFAASTYTVTTPGALPARITDNGLGCELWCEQFVAAGAASGTLVANYLDSDGNAQSGTIAAVQSAPAASQVQAVPLANNKGVKQLTSAVTDATWTSGSFGMTIRKRIAAIPIPQIDFPVVIDWQALGLPQIPTDACLEFLWLANVTTAPVLTGVLDVIDK